MILYPIHHFNTFVQNLKYFRQISLQLQPQQQQKQIWQVVMLQCHLPPTEDKFDSTAETKYCIMKSKEYLQKQKKEIFLNKLTFKYSLSKINKEKLVGCITPFTDRQYPKLSCENKRYTANQYSSPRIRANRQSFIQYRQQPVPQHKESIKKYTQLLNNQKQKQKNRGLGSFWMFKKEGTTEEKKTRVNISEAKVRSAVGGSRVNKVEQAFSKIFIFGKLAIDLQSGMISKNLFKNYLTSIFGQCFAEWFINFFQIRSFINFKQFQKLGEKITGMTVREINLISFMLYDRNGDGFICPRDVFSIFEKQLDPVIQEDILRIGQFAKDNEGREEDINQQFKIEHVIIQDDNICFKDYNVVFQKMNEPFLKATNKKDTAFSKSFTVLQHRQRLRSKRREQNQKKMMYNELFRQIARDTKNNAFVEYQDYRLNYTFFYEIFQTKPSKLFEYFCGKIFGVLKRS